MKLNFLPFLLLIYNDKETEAHWLLLVIKLNYLIMIVQMMSQLNIAMSGLEDRLRVGS